MPIYEYTCQECKRDFALSFSIKEMEAKPAVTCPDCKSVNIQKKYGGFTAMTSKKS
jgi:putative FmdB family regulatory protein